MNVKDLRKLLEGVPDDYLVLVPGGDHSFSLADVVVGSAEKEGKRQYTESGEEVATWTSVVSKAYVFNREVDALFCLSFDDLHEESEVVPYDETN